MIFAIKADLFKCLLLSDGSIGIRYASSGILHSRKSAPWCCPFSARGRDFFCQFVIDVRVLLKLMFGFIG